MGALGNSFHTVTVACTPWLLWPWSKGVRTDPLGARSSRRSGKKIWGALKWKLLWWQHLRIGFAEDRDTGTAGRRGNLGSQWRRSEEGRMAPAGKSCWCQRESCELAEHQVGAPIPPPYWVSWLWCEVGFGAHMAPWCGCPQNDQPETMGMASGSGLELEKGESTSIYLNCAILRGLEWRAQTKRFCSCRFLHLADSQICLAVLCKGTSSSRINRILRKSAHCA